MYLLLIVLLIGLVYKIYQDRQKDSNVKNSKQEEKIINKENNSDNKENDNNTDNKENNNKDDKNEKVDSNEITNKPSSDEQTEIKNETQRRGGNVTLELIGEENITISLESDYKDEGVKAYYQDGTDASNEVDIDNAVDTSKKGTYTVTYYAGKTAVIRRVTVE